MEITGLIIGAALVAWLNYALAKQRGRDPGGWAFGGAIFGLFSTILLLVLGTTEEKRTSDAVKVQEALKNK